MGIEKYLQTQQNKFESFHTKTESLSSDNALQSGTHP